MSDYTKRNLFFKALSGLMHPMSLGHEHVSPAFSNQYKGLLLADIDPDHTLVKYHFVSKLLSEVRMQQIRRLYEQKKNFDKITEECHTVYDWLLSRSNKDPG